MNNKTPAPSMLSPILLPPIEQFRISKKRVVEATKKARKELFEKEKGKTHYAILAAADKGNYCVEYKYPENCNREDIENLQNELTEAGFKVEFTCNICGDILTISWYSEK